ncbi:adenine phosphoribosyltransferase [Caldanaerobius fijiensis DSM 17918]|uniref:Adenine phosphoribosyltransferase n=1 Tax=Caldanaerobius fijiensis DSM 17918 TaxID=1121256 RepID=A0A1M4TYT0_9THEO|nr:adenine phosphoribosyltransferase [Caldanaerobius fijiensis]SHE49609.1 adenine phosphoribosyltransferase [Caldanaerobius fijiensis DSM 17918]
MDLTTIKEMIRIIPDFPKAGISFKDITTVIKDGVALKYIIDEMAERCSDRKIDIIAGPEARSFIIGAPLAYRLGVGFVPIRKPGKLPAETIKREYQLEYGTDAMELHKDAIKPGQNVLIVDDLLATGGTIITAVKLVEELGGNVTGLMFLIELTELGGRRTLSDYDVVSLIQYPY